MTKKELIDILKKINGDFEVRIAVPLKDDMVNKGIMLGITTDMAIDMITVDQIGNNPVFILLS